MTLTALGDTDNGGTNIVLDQGGETERRGRSSSFNPPQLRLLTRLRSGSQTETKSEQPRRRAPLRPVPLPPASQVFERSLADAQLTINQANHLRVTPGVQENIKLKLMTAQNEMTTARRNEQWPQATTKLKECERLARQLIASKGATDKRSEVQAQSYGQLQKPLDNVKKNYFNNPLSGSTALKTGKLDPGTEFKAFITALETVEKHRGKNYADLDGARMAAQDLVDKARAYLDHYDERYARTEPDGKAERKKQAAEEGFKQGRQLLLALKFDSLGGPPDSNQPWSSKQGMMFNQLQNQFYFETGYKQASPLGRQEGGRNQAFWVETTEFDNKGKDKQIKQRLFKPAQGEEALFGDAVDKPGMAAIRESLASSTSKLLAEQTGLDLGVPETSVVGLGGFALPDGKRGDVQLGSVQQFEKSDGGLKDKDPSLINRIPKDDWHRCAIQDIISLNVDRHGDNFMVQKTDDPAVRRLVPIDHGNTMPSPKDFKNFASDFAGCKATGTIQNVTLQQEKAYEPFSEEMLEAVSRIDPEALANGLRQHCADLDEVNPGLNAGEMFPSDAIELSKRTTIFLKAAAPYLSPAEIMLAISAFKEEFADLTVDIDDLCARVLQAQLGKGEDYKEMMLAPVSMRADLLQRLDALGWDKEALVRKSPDIAFKLLTHNVKNDPKPRDPEAAIQESDFVEGTRALIASVLSKTQQDVGRYFLLAQADFPAIKQSETERQALETVAIETEADAKSAYKRAVAYREARKKAIADSLMDQATRIYNAHRNLLDGDEQKRLEGAFGNIKQFYAALNLNTMSQNLQALREAVQSVGQRPTEPLIQKLAEAKRYIEPQVKAGEERLKLAQQTLTAIRADAAKAVAHRAANRLDQIGAVLEEATTRQTAYDEHLERSKRWLDEVTNAFLEKLPRDNELTPAYSQDKKNLDMLQLKIVQDIDAIEFFRKDVESAMKLIAKASDGDADQNALLAEVITADQNTAQTMILKAGQLESSAATDFDGLGEALAAAKKQGTEEDVRKRHVATGRKLIQEAIGKLNTLKQELAEADEFMKNARAGYPESIDHEQPPFKIPFEELQKVQDKWEELTQSHAKLMEKAKKQGQEILTLM